MPQSNEPMGRLPDLHRGFSVTRLVVGEDLSELADELRDIAEDDPALEVRLPYAEGPEGSYLDRRVAAKLVKIRDIHDLQVADPYVPLRDVYADLDAADLSFDQSIEDAHLTQQVPAPSDRQGGHFLAVGFDRVTGNRLASERQQILSRVALLGGTEELRFRRFTPDATLAYLGSNALDGTFEEVTGAIAAFLPLPVRLLPAIRRPQKVFKPYGSPAAD